MKFNKFIKFVSFSLLLSFLIVSCEEETTTTDNHVPNNHVGFFEKNETVKLEEDQVVSVEAKVFAAKAYDYDRILELEVITESTHNTATNTSAVPVTTANPLYYSVPASVTIPAGETEGTFSVSITSKEIGTGKRIVIGIKPNADYDVSTSYVGSAGSANFEIISKRLQLNIIQVCKLNPLRVAITTDRYGEESSWELYDADLNKIGEGGPYTRGAANGVYPQVPVDFCLEDGNYIFVMYDSYGDGMNSGAGEGFYRLIVVNEDGSEEIREIAKNGTFTQNDVVEFSLP